MPRIDHSVFEPGIFEPGNPMVNPLTPAAYGAAVAWCRGVGILTSDAEEQQLHLYDLGTLVGSQLPDATLDQLVLAIEGMIWFTLRDNQWDNPALPDPTEAIRATRNEVIGVCEQPGHVPADAFGAGFHHLWQALRAGSSPAALRRFRDGVVSYFEANERQTAHTTCKTVPELLEYITLRRATVGVPTWVELLVCNLGLQVPEPVRDHYLMREIVDCSSDIQGIGQDIISFEKEDSEASAATSSTCSRALWTVRRRRPWAALSRCTATGSTHCCRPRPRCRLFSYAWATQIRRPQHRNSFAWSRGLPTAPTTGSALWPTAATRSTSFRPKVFPAPNPAPARHRRYKAAHPYDVFSRHAMGHGDARTYR
ncbi:hypothetical protein GCM10010302_10850 [Streptomyces polychromogenes]|uniref:Uncharacterized protein n=1 Tax=Streptomyces polychromogenes TaxID=67342 RepID=A0ABN0V5R8_9ACTN